MTTLIAEDLLLLLLDDDKGTLSATAYGPTVLGGALLVELALAGAVNVRRRSSMWRSAKVYAEPGAAPDDPVLRDALATVSAKERSAQDLVDRLGKGLPECLGERLASRGILERHQGKVLGVFPRTRWPAISTAHEERVRSSLTSALVLGADPDQRTAALVALLHAIGRPHKTVDHRGMSSREVRRRAKAIAEGPWASLTVKDAVDASIAAITAAIAAASSAAAG